MDLGTVVFGRFRAGVDVRAHVFGVSGAGGDSEGDSGRVARRRGKRGRIATDDRVLSHERDVAQHTVGGGASAERGGDRGGFDG